MIHVFCNLEHDDEDDRLPMCNMTFEVVGKEFVEANSSWELKFMADADPMEPVGFRATVPTTGWRHQVEDIEDDEPFHSYWGPVSLRSSGAMSDRLVALLSDYYGIADEAVETAGVLSKIFGSKLGKTPGPRQFVSDIQCLAVGIASDPSLIATEPTHLKLFFDDGEEDGRYAEVFLDVDLPSGYAGLNEKDEEYRSDLVHWLSLNGSVQANPHREDWAQ